jgi:hypothetical protein
MEVYLRLMFLKFRYRLGYETLCREVADSITWRRFCPIPLDGQVPHPTTLMKLTTRCGATAVNGCTRRCWQRPPRRSCCAPPGCARTREQRQPAQHAGKHPVHESKRTGRARPVPPVDGDCEVGLLATKPLSEAVSWFSAPTGVGARRAGDAGPGSRPPCWCRIGLGAPPLAKQQVSAREPSFGH